MSKLSITYTPHLSIPENAEKAGVSVAAVRKYMAKRDISGRENNFRNRLTTLCKAVERMEKRGIAPTHKRLCEATGFSSKTVRKYAAILQENGVKTYTDLVCNFPSSLQIIKSVAYTQKEIIENIIRLYIPSKTIDCDLTYSTGKMWK